MKRPVLALAATISLALPAFAQSPAPSSPPPAAPASAPPSAAPAGPAAGPSDEAAAPEDGKGKIKEIREACREQLKGRGLKGETKMKAISACVVRQRPDVAQREQCRMTGYEKGLRKRELRGFVKDCVSAKG